MQLFQVTQCVNTGNSYLQTNNITILRRSRNVLCLSGIYPFGAIYIHNIIQINSRQLHQHQILLLFMSPYWILMLQKCLALAKSVARMVIIVVGYSVAVMMLFVVTAANILLWQIHVWLFEHHWWYGWNESHVYIPRCDIHSKIQLYEVSFDIATASRQPPLFTRICKFYLIGIYFETLKLYIRH